MEKNRIKTAGSWSHMELRAQNIRSTSKQQLQSITEGKGVFVVTPAVSGSSTRGFSITCVFLLHHECQVASKSQERKREIRREEDGGKRRTAARETLFPMIQSIHCNSIEKDYKVTIYAIKHTAA